MIHSTTITGTDDGAGLLSMLQALKEHPGWKIYFDTLNEAVVVDINCLRNHPAADIRYLQGRIAGMEDAVKLLDDLIATEQRKAEDRKTAALRQAEQDWREHSQTPYA